MAETKNITVDQGSNIKLYFVLKKLTDETLPPSDSNPYIDFDLSSYNIRMQVRKSRSSNVKLLEASTAGGEITVTSPATLGEFEVEFPAQDSSSINFSGDELLCVYDVELYDSSTPENVIRAVQGNFTLSKEVTR